MSGFSFAEVDAALTGIPHRLVNGGALGDALSRIRVERPAPLGRSGPSEIAFFFAKSYEREMLTARAGILVTGEPFVKALEASGLPIWKGSAIIACADPYLAMAVLSEKFAVRISSAGHVPGGVATSASVHASAVVDPSAALGEGVIIGANCVIEAGVTLGARTRLYPGCYIGEKATVGEDCVFFPGVTLYEWTEVGHRARLHAGVVLGSDGFGYAPIREGQAVTGHRKIYHLGRVVVGDDVEIGANSCADRATFGETRIDRRAKLDNLVHVGHNAHVGEGAILCGGVCLAGSASIGRYAYIGGLTGVGNQVHVGDGANVGALAMVTKDVPPGGTAVGNPQREYREHFRAHAKLNRLIAKKTDKGDL